MRNYLNKNAYLKLRFYTEVTFAVNTILVENFNYLIGSRSTAN